jgi:sigma-B regulation protein RsbU (phosphoserine phosphatase)
MDILIADPDPAHLVRLSNLVETGGHRTLCAEDGAEAWELYRNGDCNLVITAWSMPGLNGLELLKRIRARRSQQYTYVIIMLPEGDEALAQALKTGADDVLIAPYTPEQLRQRLGVAARIVALQEALARRDAELETVTRRLRRDLQAAESVQRTLLPTIGPLLPGVEFAWYLKSCDEVGGDTLNCFRLDERHLCLYVLDVSGHGVASALLAVQVSRFLNPLLGPGSLLKKVATSRGGYRLSHPAEVLGDLNTLFPSQPQTMQFFTMIYGLYDLDSHRLHLATAGHPGPVIVRAGGAIEIPTVSGHPIGFFPTTHARFNELTVTLAAGDRVLMYSDGATETADPEGRTFGANRLGEALRDRAGAPLANALDGVVSAMAGWRQGRPTLDDVSILALGRDA